MNPRSNGCSMKMRLTRILLLSGLAAACGEGQESVRPGSEAAVRDSLDIRIVETAEPLGQWRTRTTPRFTLGWGPDDPTFTWLQSGRILADGGALVGDFGAGSIYRVGPEGAVLDTWGRKGEGPGEYQALDAILLKGDTVLVSDSRLRRITLLSSDGELLTTRPLPGAFLHQVSAILADGRLLFIPGDGYAAIGETRPEWVFEPQPILAADIEGGVVDTLVQLPHLRRWYGDRGASPGPVPVKGRAGGFEGGFAWARSDEPEVRWYDGFGDPLQVARWTEEPRELSAEWRQRAVAIVEEALRSQIGDGPQLAAQLRTLQEGFDRHDGPLPFWDAFHVDRLGNAWLSAYPLPAQPPGRWRVVTRDGVFRSWVDLPDVVAILDITSDRMLGVRLDELNVPALVMIDLISE